MKTTLLFLLLVAQSGIAAPKVTFKDSYLRYLSGHDLFRMFFQKFPGANWTGNYDCVSLNESNRGLVGDSNPATGNPMYQAPSVTFAKWYVKCVMVGVDGDFATALNKPDGMNGFFGKKAMTLISAESYAGVVQKPQSVTWVTLSPAIQNEIVLNLFEVYIGRNILANQDDLAKKMLSAVQDKTLTTFDALKQLTLLITTQDEFITY